jgi:zearalenone synthase, highly reducing iterative type I polyketide synthase
MCSPAMNTAMTTLHFLTPDSKCQTFDEKANGYARGEGTSFVVLKPLNIAIGDNDVIRAVIRNTGSNQDGKTPGITFPSAEAQASLIRKMYEDAALDLGETGYFEAHVSILQCDIVWTFN